MCVTHGGLQKMYLRNTLLLLLLFLKSLEKNNKRIKLNIRIILYYNNIEELYSYRMLNETLKLKPTL